MNQTIQNIPLLQEAIKYKLGTEFPNIQFDNMQLDKEGSVGLYLPPAAMATKTIDGEIQYRSAKIHVQVNAPCSAQGIVDTLNYLSKFVWRMENEQCNIPNISFIQAEELEDKPFLIGRNQYNINVYGCNIDLKYIYDSDEQQQQQTQ